nr:MAG TPA: helix-turn-helix domain protein [Caudoviricetes sp.]
MVLFMQIDTSSVLRRIEIRLAEIEMPKQVFYEKSGISSGSYSQWNTGMHSPSLKKLQKAALVLGVPVEYLLYGDAPAASQGAKKAPDPEIEGGMEDEDLKEAVELLKKMDKETLRIFIKAARGALEN